MQLRIGTSGYSYPEWKGHFYPEKIRAEEMLRFYGQHFGTVEINNTFYRMPTATVLARWAEQVPEQFAFVLKAPRRITHDRRLEDVDDAVTYFLNTAIALEQKLGPVLFQLPPFFKKDLAKLTAFLELLPRSCRAAFEFRHATWHDDEVYDALRSHRAAMCIADVDEGEDPPLVSTAPWGYLRLRRADYGDRGLEEWAKRVQAQPWEEAFVFFKHEDEGKGPQFAQRFAELSR